MMAPEALRDRGALDQALRRHASLHLYELGDLDDAFFPHATFYVHRDPAGEIAAVALVYEGGDLPTLIALAGDERERAALRTLVPRVVSVLERPVYAHVSPSLRPVIDSLGRVEPRGHHLKLAWTDPARARAIPLAGAARVGPDLGAEILALLDREYPGHFFHPRVLDTQMAFGARDAAGALVAFAGVHVASARYRVAALGNVVTATAHRGRGLGLVTCAALCLALEREVDLIGLNVDRENGAALRLYDKLGFTVVAPYDELVLEPR